MKYFISLYIWSNWGKKKEVTLRTAGGSWRPSPHKASMHVKHYTSALLLNTSKTGVYVYCILDSPCTLPRPSRPRKTDSPVIHWISQQRFTLSWIFVSFTFQGFASAKKAASNLIIFSVQCIYSLRWLSSWDKIFLNKNSG